MVFEFSGGTIGYTEVTPLSVSGLSQDPVQIESLLLSSTDDTVTMLNSHALSYGAGIPKFMSNLLGNSVTLQGDLTDGDGTLRVIVKYRIKTFGQPL